MTTIVPGRDDRVDMVTSPVHPVPAPPAPDLDIVIPVHNEVAELERSVRTLRTYLDERFPFTTQVTIVDNASDDGTWEVASRLAAGLHDVRALHLSAKGRGRALRAGWTSSRAEVLAYMDVDLATGLDGLLPLAAPLVSGHSDVAIGSRLAPGACVVRGAKRELISRAYNLFVRTALQSRFSDAQCGFKALRAEVAADLLPLVADDAWFFDTELLSLAEHNGMRIHEVPVDWVDDPDTRVDIVRTALADLRGTGRLLRRFATGGGRIETAVPRGRATAPNTAVLDGVGGLSTVVYLALFIGLQPDRGGLVANAFAWTVASLGNAALGRLAVCNPGTRETARTRAVLWAAGLGLSTAVIGPTEAATTSQTVAAIALLASGAVVSTVRFAGLRQSRYRRHLESGAHRTAVGHASGPGWPGLPRTATSGQPRPVTDGTVARDRTATGK